MVIRSKIEELDEWLFAEEIPDNFVPNQPLLENHREINKGPVQMSVYQLSTSGLFILNLQMTVSEPVHIQTEIEGNLLSAVLKNIN